MKTTIATALTVALLVPASAEAWPHVSVGVHGVHVTQKHRWWRNDGRKFDWPGGDGRLLAAPRLHRPHGCLAARVAYVMHHPLMKPRSLRGLHGCSLYRADAKYHRGSDGRAVPSSLGLLLSVVS
jgi:hypothetical protein